MQENHPAIVKSSDIVSENDNAIAELPSLITISKKVEKETPSSVKHEKIISDNAVSCIPTLPESKEVISQGRKGRFQIKVR